MSDRDRLRAEQAERTERYRDTRCEACIDGEHEDCTGSVIGCSCTCKTDPKRVNSDSPARAANDASAANDAFGDFIEEKCAEVFGGEPAP